MNLANRVRGEIVTVGSSSKFQFLFFVVNQVCLPKKRQIGSIFFISNKEDGSIIPMALLNAISGLRIETSTLS